MSVSLSFSRHFGTDRFKLIEVPAALLDSGESLSVRGVADDEAVMCSHSQTYSIRKVITSNLQLIAPTQSPKDSDVMSDADQKPDCGDIVFEDAQHAHYELVKSPPNLRFLHEVLLSSQIDKEALSNLQQLNASESMAMDEDEDDDEFSPLNSQNFDGSSESPLQSQSQSGEQTTSRRHAMHYTTEQLRSSVQASDAEIAKTLKFIGAFLYRRRWRTLSPSLVDDLVAELQLVVAEKGWDLDQVIPSECISEMSSYPPEFVASCIGMFAADAEEPAESSVMSTEAFLSGMDSSNRSDKAVCLSKEKLSRHTALSILREMDTDNKGVRHEDFMRRWVEDHEQAFPLDKPDESWLKGYALRTMPPGSKTSVADATWMVLTETELSMDPEGRLQDLFVVQREWLKDDMEPYMRILKDLGFPMARIYTKHTRAIKRKVNGKMATYLVSRKKLKK